MSAVCQGADDIGCADGISAGGTDGDGECVRQRATARGVERTTVDREATGEVARAGQRQSAGPGLGEGASAGEAAGIVAVARLIDDEAVGRIAGEATELDEPGRSAVEAGGDDCAGRRHRLGAIAVGRPDHANEAVVHYWSAGCQVGPKCNDAVIVEQCDRLIGGKVEAALAADMRNHL